MKTINDIDFEIKKEDFEFNYQKSLTKRLDILDDNFDQGIINEIVLWKVNRYAELSVETLCLINSISTTADIIDVALTKRVLKCLIKEPGIQLPMASTILRFRNPKIYQIIDQRVYRLLYGVVLKMPLYVSDKNIDSQIDLYLGYLTKLKIVSESIGIPFDEADRILYLLDKDDRVNGKIKLLNYGKA